MDVTLLQPGDCLLYKPKGIFGRIIQLKTWHSISHCEVYDGEGCSWASRDGKGVARYPWRDTELIYVLRPAKPLNMPFAREWARGMTGTPYGWFDLLAFVGVHKDFNGIICSAFLTKFYRMAGWNIFPTDDAKAVAPFEFLTLVDNGFTIIYQA